KPFLFLSFLIPSVFVPCNNDTQHTVQTNFRPGIEDDRPHVLYRKQDIVLKYVVDSNVDRHPHVDVYKKSDKNKISLQVVSDEPGKTFSVKLKDRIENEKPEHEAKKIFALSDLEGNFSAFRKLLQGNGIIDADYNWTYGDGHLVLT